MKVINTIEAIITTKDVYMTIIHNSGVAVSG